MTSWRIFYATGFARALGTAMVGVLMALYLVRVGLSGAVVGLVVALGLAGSAAGAVVATFWGDRWGRRRLLLTTTVLAAAGTCAFAAAGTPLMLALAAFAGMLNGMGRDRGPALILEQSALAGSVKAEERTQAIAWYSMLQDVGHALGALLAGATTVLERSTALAGAAPHRILLFTAAAVGLSALPLYWRLGPDAEGPAAAARVQLAPASRAILIKICALFAVDSLAGGFLTTALLGYLFFQRFGASELAIACLFFGARVMNAGSHLGAAWLAKRIGLVNTMVFTHIPSSLLLMTVAVAPSFAVAAALFILREGLVEMDVPTRQSYVMAMVRPEERTFASGVTNLVRVAAWAVAPAFAGALLMTQSWYLPLLLGAGMKIAYDLLLWRAFAKLRPPEERP